MLKRIGYWLSLIKISLFKGSKKRKNEDFIY